MVRPWTPAFQLLECRGPRFGALPLGMWLRVTVGQHRARRCRATDGRRAGPGAWLTEEKQTDRRRTDATRRDATRHRGTPERERERERQSMHTGLHGFSWFVCKHTVLMGQASAAVCVSGFMRCFRDSTVYHFDVDVGDFTRPRRDRQVDSRRPAASRSARSVSQARPTSPR